MQIVPTPDIDSQNLGVRPRSHVSRQFWPMKKFNVHLNHLGMLPNVYVFLFNKLEKTTSLLKTRKPSKNKMLLLLMGDNIPIHLWKALCWVGDAALQMAGLTLGLELDCLISGYLVNYPKSSWESDPVSSCLLWAGLTCGCVWLGDIIDIGGAGRLGLSD